MITEKARDQQKIQQIKDGIEVCEQAIRKAEKYERLNDNKDWLDFWKDLDLVIQKHGRDIEQGISMLPDAPSHPYTKLDETGKQALVSSRQDWADFITQHQIQKTQLEAWSKDPARIMEFAKFSRIQLPILKDQLAELTKDSENENGRD